MASRHALNGVDERLPAALNNTGEVFPSHTVLGDRCIIRVAIDNIRTSGAEVRRCRDR